MDKSLSTLISSPAITAKIGNMWHSSQMTNAFISSVVSVVNGNPQLKNAEPMSVIGAAMIAATLQLQVNQAVGQAYIIPYGKVAQFQIGYKGLLQLALRSGQLKKCITAAVHEGELVKGDIFMEDFVFDSSKRTSDKVIGYMAHIELLNGFTKTVYKTKKEVEAHATKYSKAFNSKWDTPWKNNFSEMAMKTVLKSVLNKWVPISVEMSQAIAYDQAVVKTNVSEEAQFEELDIDKFAPEYVDNPQSKSSVLPAAKSAIETLKEKAMDNVINNK